MFYNIKKVALFLKLVTSLILVPNPEKQKLNFSCDALFHIKTGVCLKYFVHDYKVLVIQ